MAKERSYLCIDLKSYYASVECVERHLDPLTTKLVVADPERTEKTICLAVSPAMKALGVRNRCRVFEIPKHIDYIMAKPRMALYMEYAARIYGIYLRYVSEEDIHVYSIDEVFMDITDYYEARGLTAKAFASELLHEIYRRTGLTATCGLGTNLYLAKIALDIMSKRAPDHIGILTEESYRRVLWSHRPITDFWRIGGGTQRRLERLGIFDMGGVAHANEDVLYRTFGIDAELLIDHAWGRETTTMADIKAFRPQSRSLTRGQVLICDYDYPKGRIVVREMAEDLALDLFAQGLEAKTVDLSLGYTYRADRAPAHGSVAMELPTSSVRSLADAAETLYDRIMERDGSIRRINLCYGGVRERQSRQYDLFVGAEALQREERLQNAMVSIRKKYGKNGLLKCMDLQEGATAMERNRQIGGHRA